VNKIVEKKIKKEISKYLWQSDYAEPVKREILSLPIIKGGLGILDLPKQSMALRLKHMCNLKQDLKQHDSIYIQKYLLAIPLLSIASRVNEKWQFLTENNFPKTLNDPPFYLKDVIKTIRTNEDILKIKNKTTKNIYNYLNNPEKELNIKRNETFWNLQFQKNLPWEKIWLRNFNSYAQGPCQNVVWRLLHNSLPTLEKL
jgi:hypothetical protein